MRRAARGPGRPGAVTVRAARLGDAPAVAALSGELGYPAEAGQIRGRLRRILARDDQRVLVAEDGRGGVCGWLHAQASEALESGFRVEIVGLVVAGAMRRRGAGRRLVARAEAWARRIGAEAVVVRSNAKRLESHAFYPSLGYVASKTQVVYRKQPRA